MKAEGAPKVLFRLPKRGLSPPGGWKVAAGAGFLWPALHATRCKGLLRGHMFAERPRPQSSQPVRRCRVPESSGTFQGSLAARFGKREGGTAALDEGFEPPVAACGCFVRADGLRFTRTLHEEERFQRPSLTEWPVTFEIRGDEATIGPRFSQGAEFRTHKDLERYIFQGIEEAKTNRIMSFLVAVISLSPQEAPQLAQASLQPSNPLGSRFESKQTSRIAE
eukprot:scaffold999_cov289-Pinguiococcus_pyrenoidosus.AAC.10